MAYAALALAILTWGLEYPLMKSVMDTLGPLGVGAVMFPIAAVLLGVQLALRGAFCRDRLPECRVFGRMFLIGLIGFVLNAAALLAIRFTSVTNTATLARTDVLFSLVLSALFFHEKVERSAWLMTPLMLAGICLMTGIFTNSLDIGNVGDGLILFSAFLVALNAYIIRHAAQQADPSLIGFINTTVNGILFIAAVLFFTPAGEAVALLGRGFSNPVALTLGGLAALFFTTYYIALRALPVWKVRLLMLLIPVVATLAGRIWLKETVSVIQVAGMVLICTGAAGVTIVKQSKWIEMLREKTI